MTTTVDNHRAQRVHWPWSEKDYGLLPELLIALTVTTGVVDAVSYVTLGHVFVANMTGNVVFLGFAIAGAPSLSVPSSLVALAAFLLGALIGGRLGSRQPKRRFHQVRASSAVSAVLVAAAAVIAGIADHHLRQGDRYALIVLLALAMGTQNATARRLAIPDLTTTVLTLTVTGLAADSRVAGGAGGRPISRLIAVAAMLIGALIGAELAIHVNRMVPLAVAAGFLMITAVIAGLDSGTDDRAAQNSESRPTARRS